MKQCSMTTRLREYISLVLPNAHGHQQKAVCDFVLALISVQSCCQATLSYVIRTKSNYKVRIGEAWCRLDSLSWRGNQRRRAWGRVWYAETDPRRVFLAQSRARDAKGRWGVWHLLSNRPLSAYGMAAEYARRFTCEEGFRDGKRLLGFVRTRVACIKAWSRMFLLVALALAVLTQLGCALVRSTAGAGLLRRVRSRRNVRSELSLVRSIVELLAQGEDLWRLLDHQSRLNLEAGL